MPFSVTITDTNLYDIDKLPYVEWWLGNGVAVSLCNDNPDYIEDVDNYDTYTVFNYSINDNGKLIVNIDGLVSMDRDDITKCNLLSDIEELI